jgi:hypothetical protein
MNYRTGAAEKLERMSRDLLFETFTWMDTQEGHNYWEEVQRKLANHAKAAKRNSGICAEIAELEAKIAELKKRAGC